MKDKTACEYCLFPVDALNNPVNDVPRVVPVLVEGNFIAPSGWVYGVCNNHNCQVAAKIENRVEATTYPCPVCGAKLRVGRGGVCCWNCGFEEFEDFGGEDLIGF